MPKPIIMTTYHPHEHHYASHDPKSLTHQSMKDECDINNIMQKYQKNGLLSHLNQYQGEYGNFADAPDSYHESMNKVLEADEMFQSLPSAIRNRFHHDPAAFINFADDPNNDQEMIKLGLRVRPFDPNEVLETLPLPRDPLHSDPRQPTVDPAPDPAAKK